MKDWYQNQTIVQAVLETAKNLDQQYPDRKIVSLGHSPSWIVATLGMLRIYQGRDKNTAYIPFSGNIHRIDLTNFQSYTSHQERQEKKDLITFTLSSNKALDHAKYKELFNSLAKQRLSPKAIRNDDTKPPIVLDYAYTASGMASFISLYSSLFDMSSGKQLNDMLDFVLYKINYKNDIEPVSIENLPTQAVTKSNFISPMIRTITGDNAYAAEMLSGYKGVGDRFVSAEKHGDQNVLRFMPYADCASPTKEGSLPMAFYQASIDANRMREAKQAIRSALIKTDQEHQALAEKGFTILKSRRRYVDRGTWIPMSRGYHG